MAKRKPKRAETEAIGHRRAELVATEVDNPGWRPERDGERAFPRRHAAVRNVRESEVAYLYAKGALDDSQLRAADKFRRLFEALGGSGARGMDTTREFVEGGRFPEPIGDHAIDAGKKLAIAYKVLVDAHGIYAWKIVGYVCGQGVSVQKMTYTRREKDTMLDNLRMYLDCLSAHWGYASDSVVKKRA